MSALFTADAAQWHTLVYVAVAMVLGGCLGFERELAGKPAGLRTHMLVAAAAALLVSLAPALDARLVSVIGPAVRSDPLRIVQTIVYSVAFLGAGTIIRHEGEDGVLGLTTAASILTASAIGIGVAIGQIVAAAGTTALVVLTLRLAVLEPRQRDSSGQARPLK